MFLFFSKNIFNDNKKRIISNKNKKFKFEKSLPKMKESFKSYKKEKLINQHTQEELIKTQNP